jgi:hypothetical protein
MAFPDSSNFQQETRRRRNPNAEGIADRFQQSTDPVETEKLREELARMNFGG